MPPPPPKRSRKSIKIDKFDKWEEFPDEIKMKIVANLDFVDRKAKNEHNSRKIDNYTDYLLFKRRRIVRKKRTSELIFWTVRDIVSRIFRNPLCTIELLKLDDTFRLNYYVISEPQARVLHLHIQMSDCQGGWMGTGDKVEAIVDLFRYLKPELKSVTCDEALTASDEVGWDYSKNYDDEEVEDVFEDRQWLQNLQVFRFPGRIEQELNLSWFGARKLEISCSELNHFDIRQLILRWDREDVPVGSEFKLATYRTTLEHVFEKFDNVLEKSESSGNQVHERKFFGVEGVFRVRGGTHENLVRISEDHQGRGSSWRPKAANSVANLGQENRAHSGDPSLAHAASLQPPHSLTGPCYTRTVRHSRRLASRCRAHYLGCRGPSGRFRRAPRAL